nr:immunoglobulin heavy chain junction region [Mus musculus]
CARQDYWYFDVW